MLDEYEPAEDAVCCVIHGVMDYPGDKPHCSKEHCVFFGLYWKKGEMVNAVRELRNRRNINHQCGYFIAFHDEADDSCVYCGRDREKHNAPPEEVEK